MWVRIFMFSLHRTGYMYCQSADETNMSYLLKIAVERSWKTTFWTFQVRADTLITTVWCRIFWVCCLSKIIKVRYFWPSHSKNKGRGWTSVVHVVFNGVSYVCTWCQTCVQSESFTDATNWNSAATAAAHCICMIWCCSVHAQHLWRQKFHSGWRMFLEQSPTHTTRTAPKLPVIFTCVLTTYLCY